MKLNPMLIPNEAAGAIVKPHSLRDPLQCCQADLSG